MTFTMLPEERYFYTYFCTCSNLNSFPVLLVME